MKTIQGSSVSIRVGSCRNGRGNPEVRVGSCTTLLWVVWFHVILVGPFRPRQGPAKMTQMCTTHNCNRDGRHVPQDDPV